MNRSDYLHSTTACLGYTNLGTYQTHGPPYYGRGVKAPHFAATPMRTAFARGNCSDQPPVTPKVGCCDTYKFVGYPNLTDMNKMMRCKKPY